MSALTTHSALLREFSTVGGWLATRAGGHFATGYTRIDDLVESLEIVTPSGAAVTDRVPSSGAGPAPDRWWLGSEGALGVITAAWLRVHRRPTFKDGAVMAFASYADAVDATRAIASSHDTTRHSSSMESRTIGSIWRSR